MNWMYPRSCNEQVHEYPHNFCIVNRYNTTVLTSDVVIPLSSTWLLHETLLCLQSLYGRTAQHFIQFIRSYVSRHVTGSGRSRTIHDSQCGSCCHRREIPAIESIRCYRGSKSVNFLLLPPGPPPKPVSWGGSSSKWQRNRGSKFFWFNKSK